MRTGENGKMAVALTTDAKSNHAGAELEMFCEGCGYSLAGLEEVRCPECGLEFDADAPKLARVPWLHRRRIGSFRAYVGTLFMVLFTPTAFAMELSRPVRISLEDANKFRSVTLWIATASFAIVILVLPLVALLTSGTPVTFTRSSMGWVMHGISATLLAIGTFHLFVRLATDMPLFIWPGSSRSRLGPVQCYACAPLALLPIPAVPLAVWFYVLLHAQFTLHLNFNLACVAISLVFLIWVWFVSLYLFVVTRNAFRVALLGLYLPLHFVSMFVVSLTVFGLVFEVVRVVLDLLFGEGGQS